MAVIRSETIGVKPSFLKSLNKNISSSYTSLVSKDIPLSCHSHLNSNLPCLEKNAP